MSPLQWQAASLTVPAVTGSEVVGSYQLSAASLFLSSIPPLLTPNEERASACALGCSCQCASSAKPFTSAAIFHAAAGSLAVPICAAYCDRIKLSP